MKKHFLEADHDNTLFQTLIQESNLSAFKAYMRLENSMSMAQLSKMTPLALNVCHHPHFLIQNNLTEKQNNCSADNQTPLTDHGSIIQALIRMIESRLGDPSYYSNKVSYFLSILKYRASLKKFKKDALTWAINSGDIGLVKWLCTKSTKQKIKNRALQIALRVKQMGIAHYLYKQGAIIDKDCWTYFMQAAIRMDDNETITLLIEGILAQPLSNNHAAEIILYAMEIDKGEVIHACLKQLRPVLADIQYVPLFKDSLEKALLYAAQGGDTNLIKLLLKEWNVNVNTADPQGNTPLIKSIYSGYYATVSFLLKHNADISLSNHQAVNALHAALDRLSHSDNRSIFNCSTNRRQILHCLLGHLRNKAISAVELQYMLRDVRITSSILFDFGAGHDDPQSGQVTMNISEIQAILGDNDIVNNAAFHPENYNLFRALVNLLEHKQTTQNATHYNKRPM